MMNFCLNSCEEVTEMKPCGTLNQIKLSKEMLNSQTQRQGPDQLWRRLIGEGGSLLLWLIMIWMFVKTLGG